MNFKKKLKATAYVLRLAAYIIFLPISAVWCYKCNSRTSQRFYYAMCSHHVFRMAYCLLFATGIATLNTAYTWVTRDISGASLTLAVSLPLLFDRLGQPLLRVIKDSRQMMFFLTTIALTALFTAHKLTFAASIYMLLVAAVFYPSRRAIENFQSLTGIQFYNSQPDKLMEAYFD